MKEGREVPPCDLSDAVFSKLKVPKPFKQKTIATIKGATAPPDGVKCDRPLGALAANPKKMRWWIEDNERRIRG